MDYNKFGNKPGRQITTSSPRDVLRRQGSSAADTRLIEDLKNQIDDLRNQFSAASGGLSPEKVDAEIRKAVKDAVEETEKHYKKQITDLKSKEDALKEKIRELKLRISDNVKAEKESHEKEVVEVEKKLEKKYVSKISELEDKLRLANDKIEERGKQLEDLKEEKESAIQRILEEQNKKLEELAKNISLEKLGIDDPDRPEMEDVFVDPLEEDSSSGYESHVKVEDVPTTKKENMSKKVNKLKDLMGSFPEKEE